MRQNPRKNTLMVALSFASVEEAKAAVQALLTALDPKEMGDTRLYLTIQAGLESELRQLNLLERMGVDTVNILPGESNDG